MTDQLDELKRINELTRKSYNIVAQKYHNLFKDEMNEKEYDRLLLDDFVKYFKKKDTILDVGCGPSGHIGRYLFDKGLNVIGIDISDKCIEIATGYNSGMEFRIMDFSQMDFADNTINGIISFYSIIHTPKKFLDQIFSEFKRVLKPGGKLLLSVKKGDDESLLDEFLGYNTKIFFTHFNEEEIAGYIEKSCLRLISLETRNPYKDEILLDRIYTIAEKSTDL
jgi:ubiquinone/menaquinone biosynthesis C-methylase UbiE